MFTKKSIARLCYIVFYCRSISVLFYYSIQKKQQQRNCNIDRFDEYFKKEMMISDLVDES